MNVVLRHHPSFFNMNLIIVNYQCHIWASDVSISSCKDFVIKLFMSWDSQMVGNYSNTRLVFETIVILNQILLEIIQGSPHRSIYQRSTVNSNSTGLLSGHQCIRSIVIPIQRDSYPVIDICVK